MSQIDDGHETDQIDKRVDAPVEEERVAGVGSDAREVLRDDLVSQISLVFLAREVAR